MRNALSVDVEDWYQVGAFETTIPRGLWPACEDRVVRNTEAALALFDRAGVKATFFTLGSLAARHPRLMARIAAAGHELASHGWDHRRVFTLGADGFRADIRRARAAIEDAGGVAVTGYRAPSFSIDTRTQWAHPILAEEGYAYSSSVAPVRHDHYGWPGSPRGAWRPLADAGLIELPVTTARLLGRTLAAGGGGFFRLLPYAFSRWAIAQANGEDRPAVFYFHPWEIDPDQPRVAGAPLRSRVRHYSRLRSMERRLETLFRAVAWDRTDRVARVEAERLGVQAPVVFAPPERPLAVAAE